MSREQNGDEQLPLSTHLVEVVEEPIGWGLQGSKSLARIIEGAYAQLHERAKAEDSIIVGVVQAVTTYPKVEPASPASVLVILTAQRISREDLERQQRAMQITQGGPRPMGPRR